MNERKHNFFLLRKRFLIPTSILFKNQYGYTKAHSLPQIPHSTQYNGGYGIRARSFLILNLSKNHDSQQISDQNTLMSWFLFHKLFYKRLNFVSRWFIFTRYGRTVRVSINLMKIQIRYLFLKLSKSFSFPSSLAKGIPIYKSRYSVDQGIKLQLLLLLLRENLENTNRNQSFFENYFRKFQGSTIKGFW